jgi:murein L,D-transpeptidase YcbB/YkuD
VALLTLGAKGTESSSKPIGSLSLEVNIPAFRVDVLRESSHVTSFGIAVGRPRYFTPTGDFEVTLITWNPWWYPPNSYWARKEKITRPGPNNPMGKVKLLLRGNIFFHGTPLASSIGSAASHACMRMRQEDAIALARLVQGAAGAAIGDSEVNSLLATWDQTREVQLPIRVPVRIVYMLAEVRGDSLLLHPDIYHHGITEDGVIQILHDSDFDTRRLNRASLKTLLRRARKEHVAVPLDELH